MEDDGPVYDIPEITPQELAARLRAEPELVVLDVRERFEVVRARLDDPRVVYAPLSELAMHQFEALPAPAQNLAAPLVVLCHLGQRSAQVVYWLRAAGWSNVINLRGGIHAYAQLIDPQIGFY